MSFNKGKGKGKGKGEEGPPSDANMFKIGEFMHVCEDNHEENPIGTQFICKVISETGEVPRFNIPVYTQDKVKLGMIDEIFGPITRSYFSVRLDVGVQAKHYRKLGSDAPEPLGIYIDKFSQTPVTKFLGEEASSGKGKGKGKGGGKGGKGKGKGKGFGKGASKGKGKGSKGKGNY